MLAILFSALLEFAPWADLNIIMVCVSGSFSLSSIFARTGMCIKQLQVLVWSVHVCKCVAPFAH